MKMHAAAFSRFPRPMTALLLATSDAPVASPAPTSLSVVVRGDTCGAFICVSSCCLTEGEYAWREEWAEAEAEAEAEAVVAAAARTLFVSPLLRTRSESWLIAILGLVGGGGGG